MPSFVSDFFDFSIYVDARKPTSSSGTSSASCKLRDTVFRDPSSYFHRYASLTHRGGGGERRATSGRPSTR
jgi:type I pantothenate kinase